MTAAEQTVSALCAPFPENEIKWRPQGDIQIAFITARHVMNRLDSVVGPENWFDEYIPFGDNGVLCKLYVRFEDTGFITKCGIGGAAGMSNEDDNEKSAFSSALKIAAVKFGVGRYLYNNGVPDFCGECPMPRREGG